MKNRNIPAGGDAWAPCLAGADGRVLGQIGHASGNTAGGVAILPDSRSLIVGHPDGIVRRISLLDGAVVWTGQEAHQPVLQDVARSRDGRLVASCAEDRLIRLWNAECGGLVATLTHVANVNQASFSPADDFLAAACDDGAVNIWHVATAEHIAAVGAHDAWVVSVDWSPQGDLVAMAANDATVQIVSVPDGALVQAWASGSRPTCVAWSPDGEQLATGWEDGSVLLRRRGAWDETLYLEGHAEQVNCLAWSPDGRLLATAGNDSPARIWEPATGRMLLPIGFQETFVWRMSWAPNGAFLAACLCGGVVQLWDVRSR